MSKVNEKSFALVKQLQENGLKPRHIKETVSISEATQWYIKQASSLENYKFNVKNKKKVASMKTNPIVKDVVKEQEVTALTAMAKSLDRIAEVLERAERDGGVKNWLQKIGR